MRTHNAPFTLPQSRILSKATYNHNKKSTVFPFSGFLARTGASHQLNIQEAGENFRLPSKKGKTISYLLGALGPDLNKILITNLFKVKYPYSV